MTNLYVKSIMQTDFFRRYTAMKKIIALILTLIMLTALAAPVAFATDVRTNTPVVFIRGASRNVYANDTVNDDELIWPLNVDIGAHLKQVLMPCLRELAAGLVTDDFSRYGEELYNAFAPLYKNAILDKNGEVSDGSGDGRTIYDFGYPSVSGSYGLMDCDFGFDPRISPLVIADDLRDYIDLVVKHSGGKRWLSWADASAVMLFLLIWKNIRNTLSQT